jgi:Transposase DDE domain group 1
LPRYRRGAFAVQVGRSGRGRPDARFIVTNVARRRARFRYEEVYCRRGQAENHITSFKIHLPADRISCTKATANQLRLFLHAGAYWLMWV